MAALAAIEALAEIRALAIAALAIAAFSNCSFSNLPKNNTLKHCCFNVGPSSATLVQR